MYCRDLVDDPAVLQKRKALMHRERKWLALRLKEMYADEDREKLFGRWGITQIKERKKALVLRLWDPSVRKFDLFERLRLPLGICTYSVF